MTEHEWLESVDPVAMLDWLNTPASLNGKPWCEWKPSDRKLRLAAAAVHLKFAKTRFVWEAAVRLADGDVQGARREINKVSEGRSFDSWLCTMNNIEYGLRTFCTAGRVDKACCAHILRDIVGNPWRPVTLPLVQVPCPDCEPGRPEEYCDDCSGDGYIREYCPWLTPLVVSLAEAAYTERQPDGTLYPDRLAVLWDALEDAGMEQYVQCCKCGGRKGRISYRRCEHCNGTGCEKCDDDGGIEHWERCEMCEGEGRQPHPLRAALQSPGPHYPGMAALDVVLGRA